MAMERGDEHGVYGVNAAGESHHGQEWNKEDMADAKGLPVSLVVCKPAAHQGRRYTGNTDNGEGEGPCGFTGTQGADAEEGKEAGKSGIHSGPEKNNREEPAKGGPVVFFEPLVFDPASIGAGQFFCLYGAFFNGPAEVG